MIRCSNCHQPFPEQGFAYRCSNCGGVYDYYPHFPLFEFEKYENRLPGIWGYRHTFALPDTAPVISLGEGKTPLKWININHRKIALKLEYENPTGSHKDRGVAVMTSFLKSLEISEAIEDSSGNAGASFAAYGKEAGIKTKVYIPDYASGPKRDQMYQYSAEVIRILGKRSDVADLVKKKAENGEIYASHAYLPHLLPGYATIAYELLEQMGQLPGTIVAPVGQGGLLLGIGRGFENLLRNGIIDKMPIMVGVQAMACAPLWAVFTMGRTGLSWVTEGKTIAEGVRTLFPVRGDALLQLVGQSGGTFVAVEEENILKARDELAQKGFKVEPTSALVWDALYQIKDQVLDPIVLILTGAGYKSAI